MPSKSQSGFAPILIVILIAIIGGSTAFVFKNIPFNQPKQTPIMEKQGTSSAQVNVSQGPSKKLTPKPIASAKATPTSSPSNTASGSTSNNSNSNPTPTATPVTSSNSTQVASPSPIPIPSPSSTSTTNSGITVTTSCNGSSAQVSVYGDIPSPSNRNDGLWCTLVDNKMGQTMIYEYDGNQGYSTIHIAANFPPTGSIRGNSFSVIGDGRTYEIKVYAEPFTSGTPSLNNLVAQTSFSITCP